MRLFCYGGYALLLTPDKGGTIVHETTARGTAGRAVVACLFFCSSRVWCLGKVRGRKKSGGSRKSSEAKTRGVEKRVGAKKVRGEKSRGERVRGQKSAGVKKKCARGAADRIRQRVGESPNLSKYRPMGRAEWKSKSRAAHISTNGRIDVSTYRRLGELTHRRANDNADVESVNELTAESINEPAHATMRP